jgi:SAM-dependent methyltransferase
MTPNPKTPGYKSAYEDQYIEWKEWGEEFGKITPDQRKYFDSELNRIKLQKGGQISVLEIGFGNGEFLEYCTSKGWEIEGIEVNEKLIKTARDKGFSARDTKYINQYEASKFDIVAAFDVLEHLDVRETLEILNSVNRILKENGFFLMRFPNGDSPFGLKNQNGDVTHKQSIGIGKIKYYSKSTGFEILYLNKPNYIIWTKNIKKMIYGVMVMPFIKFLNLAVRYIFYQGAEINFFSQNLIVILQPKMNRETKNTNR